MLLKKVKIMENVKLDFFHLEESSINNPDIFANTKYKPSLNNYSKFLATFDNASTIAKGITDEALGYTFSIYRELKVIKIILLLNIIYTLQVYKYKL